MHPGLLVFRLACSSVLMFHSTTHQRYQYDFYSTAGCDIFYYNVESYKWFQPPFKDVLYIYINLTHCPRSCSACFARNAGLANVCHFESSRLGKTLKKDHMIHFSWVEQRLGTLASPSDTKHSAYFSNTAVAIHRHIMALPTYRCTASDYTPHYCLTDYTPQYCLIDYTPQYYHWIDTSVQHPL